MIHLPALIQDLALILIAAGVVAVLFRRIGQPIVLGYILSGFLVGPHSTWFPSVSDLPNIQIWADIGVIFLLFGLGIEFSFKKLARVGGAASVTAFFEVSGTTALGFLTGRLFGWSMMDSLFLGGVLAISSTTIIIRAFSELGQKGRGYVNLVFGILIVEDLVAVLLMVLLSTVAMTREFDGAHLFYSVIKLLFSVTLWFLAGIFLLPTLLKTIRSHINEEMLLVVALGLCFLMVVIATKAGFSPALGAFVMGSVLAETVEAERIEALIQPVKDLFGAIFFVSVGMMMDPGVLFEYAIPIVVITLVMIFSKFTSTVVGALLAGRSLRHSVQAGLSLAQIGEFSFIIATLGLSLKVTSDFLYPIVVGVSALSTLSAPYRIRSADRVFAFIEARLPSAFRQALVRYALSTQRVAAGREWQRVLRAYAWLLGTNAVIITAIFLFLSRYLPPILGELIGSRQAVRAAGLLIATLCSAPFFWALLMSRVKSAEISRLWENRENRVAIVVLEVSRVVAAYSLFALLTPQFFRLRSAAGIILAMGLILIWLFSRYLKAIYAWFEKHFIRNLSEREQAADTAMGPLLAPWDAHISYLDVSAQSGVIGRTLEEFGVREKFGVTVALIERGKSYITAPARNERLFPGDRIAVIGTDDQIMRLSEILEPSQEVLARARAANYSLHQVRIQPRMTFVGRTIRESGIREQTDGLVVGLERGGQRVLNPDSSVRIEPGDLLWIVGDLEKIKRL